MISGRKNAEYTHIGRNENLKKISQELREISLSRSPTNILNSLNGYNKFDDKPKDTLIATDVETRNIEIEVANVSALLDAMYRIPIIANVRTIDTNTNVASADLRSGSIIFLRLKV